MTSISVIRNIVNDLINNQDYSIEGLATYTGYPEEVIFDVSAGINKNPTLNLATKIIELHMLCRREFYNDLIKEMFKKI